MKTVLLVEDDPWQADLAKSSLNTQGVSVVVARDAITAIHEVDRQIPSVIVLDIFLPGPNGLAFLHELRSYKDSSAVPVIVWSSVISANELSRLKPYGVVDVVDKSTTSIDELVLAVKKVII